MTFEKDLPPGLCPPLKKRVGGRMGGLGGKNYGNAFPAERLGPCALAKGVSFPPEERFSVDRP